MRNCTDDNTYIGYDLDVDVGGLLGGIGRWPVTAKGIRQRTGVATLGLSSDLLPGGAFPLLADLRVIVVLVAPGGGERV